MKLRRLRTYGSQDVLRDFVSGHCKTNRRECRLQVLAHSFLVVKKKDELVGFRVTCPFFTVVRVLPITLDLVIKSWNSHNTAFLQATITTPVGYISISSLSRPIETFNGFGLNSSPNILTRDERRSATEGSNAACSPKPNPQGDSEVRPNALTRIDDEREAGVANVSSW